MKTRCSKCHTRYEIDLDAVLAADGMARCFRCGTVFNALTEEVGLGEATDLHQYHRLTLDRPADAGADLPDTEIPWTDLPEAEIHDTKGSAAAMPEQVLGESTITRSARRVADVVEPAPREPAPAEADTTGSAPTEPDAPESALYELEYSQPAVAEAESPAAPAAEQAGPTLPEPAEPAQRPADTLSAPAPETTQAPTAPPFEIPEDLAPLRPADEEPVDVLDTLVERRSWRGLVYGTLALLLMLGMGLQLAWQYRAELVDRYPQLEPLCQHIECRPSVVRAPQAFRVLHRNLSPTPGQPGSLTLNMRFRNEAQAAQPLPDIQLSLLDTNGKIVVRRRLAPHEYLIPAPAKDAVIAVGEVVTIDLDFKDPGYLATSFEIDFF